jgi:hypothetical protein
MSQQNNIAVVIPADVLLTINDHLAKLQAAIAPYLIALTAAERQSMPKMGDGTVAFVNKVLSYSATNPEFAPAFMSVPDMLVDGNAVTQLTPVFKLSSQLNANIEDTLTLSGSEAYIAALMYYHSVKQAAKNNIPGAKTIYADLSLRFPGKARNNNP